MKKIIVYLTLVVATLTFFVKGSYADDEDNNVGFSIQAVIPDNQIDKEQSYFDLRMEPGQEETLTVHVSNSSDKDSKFSINVNQAYTNANGFIDYADKDVKKDKSLKYDINDIATYEKSIEVPANSTKEFPITLKMPEEPFDGHIMAGIQVIKDQDTESKGISNQYGYVLGLQLSETDNEVERTLNLISVKPAVSFAKTSVVAQLQNPTMDGYGHLKYEATIKNKETGKEERTVTYDNGMQIAPNSTYDFAIDWEGKALVAGDYTLDLVVSDAKDNVWKFNKDFTITKKEAKEINEVTVDAVHQNKIPMWVIVLIIVLVAIIVLGIIIYFLKRRKDKKAAKRAADRAAKLKELTDNEPEEK